MPAADFIPILDLAPQIDQLWDELHDAVTRVMRCGRFILGSEGGKLESAVAAYLGVKHAIGCNSGTDALVIALRALGVGPGDEVITPAFTFVATAESVANVGARPVFVDIDADTFNLDPAAVASAVTPRTKAIIPVHLFGQSADMGAVTAVARRHGLKVIEDTAQAFGGRYEGQGVRGKLAALGDAGALSFFPSKNLGAFGDAGMVVTNDDAVAESAQKLRTHGSIKRYHHELVGYNSRLDELQAAVLNVMLPHVDAWNEGRRRAAARYGERLADVPWVAAPPEAAYAHHVYHQYTVRILPGAGAGAGVTRDAVHQHMTDAGVGTMIYYPVPIHRMPVYTNPPPPPELPVTDQAAREVLSLPIGPMLSDGVIERVVTALRGAVAARA